MKKILFISHEASQTGAPLILLNFARWIKKENKQIEFDFLLLKGGSYEKEFYSLANVYYWFDEKSNKKKSYFARIKNKISPENYKKDLIVRLIKNDYDIIYANTILCCSVAIELANFFEKKPYIIAHVHELNAIIRQYEPNLKTISSGVDSFIAVSQSVKKNLIENWEINAGKIKLVSEFASIKEIKEKTIDSESTTELSPFYNKFIVGGSGNAHWRKGDDLFLQVARYLYKKNKEFEGIFVWIGSISTYESIIIEEDIRKLNLTDKVYFLGQKDAPYNYFSQFDIFLMTSREDPFPLVSIEVGMLGKPIICFEKAGGTEEMIADGGGKIVPYMDIEAMAEEVLQYYKFSNKKSEDGRKLKNEFIKYDIETIAPQLLSIINESTK